MLPTENAGKQYITEIKKSFNVSRDVYRGVLLLINQYGIPNYYLKLMKNSPLAQCLIQMINT